VRTLTARGRKVHPIADRDLQSCPSLVPLASPLITAPEARTGTRALANASRRDVARALAALVAPLYAWFIEGFATRDLQDTKVLLAELA